MNEKARQVRMLILDVDGVLTDGGIYYSCREEYKRFNVRDGLGIKMLVQEGIAVGIISGRTSEAVVRRAQELGIVEVHQGIADKVAVFEEIIKKHRIEADQVAFVGDDLADIPLLKRVGFAAGVADAEEAVKEHVHYICERLGGKGAVREVCDLILKAQGRWTSCLQRVCSTS